MKILKVIIALTIATLLISGCAKKMWINPNVTNEQAQKEFAECQYDSVKHTPSYDLVSDPIAAGISQGMRKDDIMSTCMASKGYLLKAQEKSEDMSDVQKTVQERYKQATLTQNKKLDVINAHVVESCRPKDDKGYIECLNEAQLEMVSACVFPEITTKMFKEEEEFKQQLLRKEISRKEFKEYTSKMQESFTKQMAMRTDSDIKAGIYTGNTKY